ncbi:Protein M3 [Entophlyctis sp. JEL0112]|nr:Protein M3 [Entophlyctis sp. JEL0112]
MTNVNLTPAVVWAACRPVLKLVLVMGTAPFRPNAQPDLSRHRRGHGKAKHPEGVRLEDHCKGSACLVAYLGTWLISSQFLTITKSNSYEFGVMTLASMCHLAVGGVLGVAVMLITQPPVGFRYGTILAVTMANCGDVALAIILSVGNGPPFQAGDSTFGVFLVSAYLCFTNLFFFSAGYSLFGEDMKALAKTETFRASLENGSFQHAEDNSTEKVKINDMMGSTAVLSPSNFHSRDHLIATQSDIGVDAAGELATRQNTSDAAVKEPTNSVSSVSSASPTKWKKYWKSIIRAVIGFQSVVSSLLSPANTATIIGLIFANIVVIRNAFVSAGEGGSEPPLSFLLEAIQFLGNAAVPLGLMNLGAALGRLNVERFIPFKIIFGISVCRLVIMPAIGIAFIELLVSKGVIPADAKMLRFVLMLEACMPTASSTVYFTQMWHPKGEANAIAGVILVELSFPRISNGYLSNYSSKAPLKVPDTNNLEKRYFGFATGNRAQASATGLKPLEKIHISLKEDGSQNKEDVATDRTKSGVRKAVLENCPSKKLSITPKPLRKNLPNVIAILRKHAPDRTAAEILFLKSVLKQLQAFRNIPDKAIAELSKTFSLVKFQENREITSTEVEASWFIVLVGLLKVKDMNSSGSCCMVGCGECVGDIGSLKNEKLSMITKSEAILVKIDKQEFFRISSFEKQFEKREICKFFRNYVPWFENLPDQEVTSASEHASWRFFPANSTIIAESQRINLAFIVKSGTCNVYRKIDVDGGNGVKSSTSVQVDKISTGSHFNYQFLRDYENISGCPCTVKAVTDVQLAEIEAVGDWIYHDQLDMAPPHFLSMTETELLKQYFKNIREKRFRTLQKAIIDQLEKERTKNPHARVAHMHDTDRCVEL